jgi:hypothetical protein
MVMEDGGRQATISRNFHVAALRTLRLRSWGGGCPAGELVFYLPGSYPHASSLVPEGTIALTRYLLRNPMSKVAET